MTKTELEKNVDAALTVARNHLKDAQEMIRQYEDENNLLNCRHNDTISPIGRAIGEIGTAQKNFVAATE